MRFAENAFGPDGGESISSALRLLAGLRRLDVRSTLLKCMIAALGIQSLRIVLFDLFDFFVLLRC